MKPDFEHEGIKAFNCDCMDFMKEIPDEYYGLSICDPPYGMDGGKKKKYHARAFTQYKPKNWDSNRPSIDYFNELFRVSREQIIWGGNYFVEFLPAAKNWIVWDKLQPEGISFSMHELAFYSGNGQAMIFRGYHGGNRCVVKELAKQYIRIHPTQKPIPLYRWLLTNYAKPGQCILDTHGGSFSSAIACHNLGFDLDICEIDKDYFGEAVARFKRETKQLNLFAGQHAKQI